MAHASNHKRMPDPSPDLQLSHGPKIPKIEPGLVQSPLAAHRPSPNHDFSGSVKKRLATSSRTGQACDRCKIRKIRCDPRPEGCSPCAQNRTPCRTTDRITGRATTRGQVEAMESENSFLRAQVAELQAQLKDMGIEPRSTPTYSNFPSATASAPWPNSNSNLNANQNQSKAQNHGSEWGDASTRHATPSPTTNPTPTNSEIESTRPLPTFKHNSFGDNYLGVSSADSLLTNLSGTSMSVFGHEIDITDFVDDKDYDTSYMSYTYVMRVALNHMQPEPAPLPPYRTLRDYCNWYFRSMHPYLMVLDKPVMMKLIERMENEPGYTLTPSETVNVHMIIASLTYQISVRNQQPALLEESHRHYRYALSFFKDLWLSHTWRDVTSLTLMVHHLRNFPKPGAAWIMASTTFQLAIELGYHRSSKAWANSGDMDPVEVESRKRTFWALHALTCYMCGKLGRPMPIHMEDVDVEIPEPINDCLPGEDAGLDDFHKCSFQVGIQVVKFSKNLSQLHRTLYSINPPPVSYQETLKRLEDGVKQWKEELPIELRDPATASQEDYIFAVYLDYWYHEYHILMYHPSVCRSDDPNLVNASLEKCLSACKRLLRCCTEMRKLRSLDCTWVNIVTHVGAIFTTLFGHYQKRDRMSSADMETLKRETDEWVELIAESGKLLGFGDRLKDEISQIIERSLANINGDIIKRTASQTLAQAALQAPPEQPPAPSTYTNGTHRPSYSSPGNTNDTAAVNGSSQPQGYSAPSTSAGYSFTNGTQISVPHQGQSGIGQTSFSTDQEPSMAPSHSAPLQQGSGPPPNTGTPYAYSNAQMTTTSSTHQSMYSNEIPQAEWHQWTRATMAYKQAGSQAEYLNSVRALDGREGSVSYAGGQGGHMSGPMGGIDDSSVLQTLGSSNWPLMQFVPTNNAFGSHQYGGQQ